MRCEDISELIADYSADNLPHKTKIAIEAHLKDCSACAAELDSITQLMYAVERMQPIEPPAGLWNGVQNRITADAPKRRGLALFPVRRRSAVSIAAATAVAVSVLFFGSGILQNDHIATDPAQIDYVQGHISAATFDPMADRINIGIVSGMQIERRNSGQ